MALKFENRYASRFYCESDLDAMAKRVKIAHEMLHGKTGPGNDFLGWCDLPINYDKSEFSRIKSAAAKIKKDTDILIVIGIGGSYLGARAAIEFLTSPLYNSLNKDTPDIYFAGCNLSGTAINELLSICEGKRVSVNVISKSGTTTEPAIAFRIFREYLEKKYGAAANERIYCTTDKARGTLKELADEQGYEQFIIPDDVGGRFSVLTAVGLLPIAVAGADIDALMNGAAMAMKEYANPDINDNPCYKYAAMRNVLHEGGKLVEMLVSYDPKFTMMSEWFKQLYGESEGKNGKGILPTAATFTTDLHSMGQYIQDGSRIVFETIVSIENSKNDIVVGNDDKDGDGLNFLAGKKISVINKKAMEGTILAHVDGGAPNLLIEIDAADEEHLGRLIYFFEKACAISGYILGVNPFDQPGVEEYKKNMFAMLGKPGYEKQREVLLKRLSK